MLPYICPAMDTASDSAAIQTAISQAVAIGVNRVLIPKKKTRQGFTHWEIDKTILLPSNITILLDNCHLRLKDGVFEIFSAAKICIVRIPIPLSRSRRTSAFWGTATLFWMVATPTA